MITFTVGSLICVGVDTIRKVKLHVTKVTVPSNSQSGNIDRRGEIRKDAGYRRETFYALFGHHRHSLSVK